MNAGIEQSWTGIESWLQTHALRTFGGCARPPIP